MMRHSATAAYLLTLLLLVSGCATSPDGASGPLTGTAGPVEWEVTNVGRVERADALGMRWSFTVVLRETAGTTIQFERFEGGAHSPNLATGGITRRAFNRRLAAKAELRDNAVETWGWVRSAGTQFGGMARLGSLPIERRYIGKDANGRPIVVPVRIELHRGFGQRSRQPASPNPPLPPVRSLQPTDLPSLAGRWEGYTHEDDYQVPLEAAIRDDGSVEFAENDPVTSRFRASLTIRDGRLFYVGRGRDSGEFVLHQDGPTRTLAGRFTLAASGNAPQETTPLRLEWKGPASGAATPAPVSPTPPAAVASAPAMPAEPAPPGMVSGTYRGTVSGDQQGRPYSAQVTLTLPQHGDEITGTWLMVGGASGTVLGRLVALTRVELRIEQVNPCPAQFTGAATIGEGGASLGGSYTGTGCHGPLATSFTVVRQP